jgi:hypothetical protein
MNETVQIALSYVRSHADDLGIERAVFKGQQFHVHLPAGAAPKDDLAEPVRSEIDIHLVATVAMVLSLAYRPPRSWATRASARPETRAALLRDCQVARRVSWRDARPAY